MPRHGNPRSPDAGILPSFFVKVMFLWVFFFFPGTALKCDVEVPDSVTCGGEVIFPLLAYSKYESEKLNPNTNKAN